MAEDQSIQSLESVPKSWNTVGKGLFLWFVLLVITAFAFGAICGAIPHLRNSAATLIAFCQPGLWQWLSVLPVFFMLRKGGRFEGAKGLLIGAFGLVIVNALCSGSFFLPK